MKENKSASRTLLMSVLLSAPGPLVVAVGLLSGHGSSQVAQLLRRSVELLAIIMSFIVYRTTTRNGNCDEAKKAKLEKIFNIVVGSTMCIGGTIMILLALLSGEEDKGNVIPGLIVALFGLVTNLIFWVKYLRLYSLEKNVIFIIQARLYRAKSMVDGCVTVALLALAIAPTSPISNRMDMVGSVIVALYLIWCGIKTVWEAVKKKDNIPTDDIPTE